MNDDAVLNELRTLTAKQDVLADKLVTLGDSLVVILNQSVAVQNRLNDLVRLYDGLLVDTRSAKAAALDAATHGVNLSTDIDHLLDVVGALGERVDALERTVRGLKIYKNVSSNI